MRFSCFKQAKEVWNIWKLKGQLGDNINYFLSTLQYFQCYSTNGAGQRLSLTATECRRHIRRQIIWLGNKFYYNFYRPMFSGLGHHAGDGNILLAGRPPGRLGASFSSFALALRFKTDIDPKSGGVFYLFFISKFKLFNNQVISTLPMISQSFFWQIFPSTDKKIIHNII